MMKKMSNYKGIIVTQILLCSLLIGDIFNIFYLELISVSILMTLVGLSTALFIWSIIVIKNTANFLNTTSRSEIEEFENGIGFKLYRPINFYTILLSQIAHNKKRDRSNNSQFDIDNPFGSYLNFFNFMLIVVSLIFTNWTIACFIYILYSAFGLSFHYILVKKIEKYDIKEFYEENSN